MIGLGAVGGILASLLGGALSQYLTSGNKNSGMNALQNMGQGSGFSQVSGGGQLGQFSTLNPQQQGLQSQLLSLLGGQLGQPGGQPGSDPIAQYAQQQFQQEGLPQLVERFTQQGSTLQGSGFRNAALGAQANLSGQLGANRYAMLQNLLGPALSPTTNQIYQPKEHSGMSGLFKGLAGGIGSALPLFAASYGLGNQAKGL